MYSMNVQSDWRTDYVELEKQTDALLSGETDLIANLSNSAAPVSYTHLDVYKRQATGSYSVTD